MQYLKAGKNGCICYIRHSILEGKVSRWVFEAERFFPDPQNEEKYR